MKTVKFYTKNTYRVNWNGYPQPIGNVTYKAAMEFILHCLSTGDCTIGQFELFDKYGKLKTSIINDPNADPTLSANYVKLFPF